MIKRVMVIHIKVLNSSGLRLFGFGYVDNQDYVCLDM